MSCHCKHDELQCGYVVWNALANYYKMRKLCKTLTSMQGTQSLYHGNNKYDFLKKESSLYGKKRVVYQVKRTFVQFSKRVYADCLYKHVAWFSSFMKIVRSHEKFAGLVI